MKYLCFFAVAAAVAAAPALACLEHSEAVVPAQARASFGSLFSRSDYPAAARAAGEQGVVRFKLAVGSNGRVTDCTVTASSGSSALDGATCRILRSRARFTPARDSEGRPTADSAAGEVTWSTPGGPPAAQPPRT